MPRVDQFSEYDRAQRFLELEGIKADNPVLKNVANYPVFIRAMMKYAEDRFRRHKEQGKK